MLQPSGTSFFTTGTLELLLSKLPKQAREAHRAPVTNNLLSVSVLCDAGCEVLFHPSGCEITYNGETIIRGWRCMRSNMWRISLTDDGTNNVIPEDTGINDQVEMPSFFANSIYECENTDQLLQFYHATMGFPATSTWCKAIDAGYFKGWPGLTTKRVRRFIKVTDETELGHMDQRRAGIRSTRVPPDTAPETDAMEPVLQTPLNDRTHHVYMTTSDVEGKLYSDQTGRFPITSNRGNSVVAIFYCADGNYIKSYPIKSRHKSNLLKAYNDVYDYLRVRGYRPQLHKLDNETSRDVEDFIADQGAKHQYTPADIHRTNIAERCVRTWKNHFTATRAGTPPSFRMANWCRMCEQCDITLNMMRPCTTNPKLSAFEAMEGMYSFDATPMAPVGTEILMHIKPIRRHTWEYHAMKAHYFAPSLSHYRVIKALTETGSVRLTDTWKFKHHSIKVPTITSTDRIVQATRQLTAAIQGTNNPPPDELEAIEHLRALIMATSSSQPLPAKSVSAPTETPASPSPIPPSTAMPPHRPTVAQHAPVKTLPTIIDADQDEALPALDAAYISDDEEEDELPLKEPLPTPRYNLRSRQNLVNDVNSNINPGLIPAIHVNRPQRKLAHGYGAANHALQLFQLGATMKTNFPKEFAGAIIDEATGNSLEFRHLIKLEKYRAIWMKSFANELGRLAQGIRDIPGTDTIDFIPRSEVPSGETVTYGRIVCTYRPQKEEQNRTRLTVGGNLIICLYDVSAPTSDMITAKLLFNSVISTPGARFLTLDLKNFYLNTPLPTHRFMKMKIEIMPAEIIEKYNLQSIAHNGWVFFRIKKGMYGLPEAGILANKLLKKRLLKSGYYEAQFTPGLYRHVWRPIMFSLVVDDFGVKCEGIQHAKHLKTALEQYYDVAVDWDGKLFCGITLDWNYKMRHVDLSVPGYVGRKLIKYQHPMPTKPQHSPYQAAPIIYGAKVQQPTAPDTSAPLTDEQIKHVQDIVGTFIWYGRACDPTLAAGLSAIGSRQTKGTAAVLAASHQLLDYLATHPNAAIRYHASDMVLAFDTDASYLSEVGGKSRAAAYYYMTREGNRAFTNGAVDVLSTIIKHVMSSASEAESGALYYGCKRAMPYRTTLEEMGHPQTKPTPVTTDNNTAHGLAIGTMSSKASKPNDMRFQWLKCRAAQRLFRFLWAKGHTNRADYPSKHHQASHHQRVRPSYVIDRLMPQ